MRTINPQLTVGISLFTALLLFIFLTPTVSRNKPNDIDLLHIELPPSQEHWFGTDSLGRDILARTAAGGKVSLAVGIAATGIRTLIAVLMGSSLSFLGMGIQEPQASWGSCFPLRSIFINMSFFSCRFGFPVL